ncbi:P-loop containing nucleoside triphosphate hydrolase protein [Xylogone sp. PMI_703]|nr:P-loop containing nucleoside triphosphate hydrolase protein [Xylogone sp. PMI_703]
MLWENAEPVFSNVPSPSSCSSTEVKNIVIAVMGVTGSGKSTFIKTISGRDDVIVGNNLTSETSEVRAYEFSHKDTNYTLIDTPGFDDTNFSDSEITELILNWLKTSFIEDTRLNGVIYLHRICDPRMGGTALRNNRMFRKLCGEEAFKNIILATTFWENISADVGERREKELRETHDFWGGMLQKGAQMVRLQRDRRSGLELLEQISTNKKVTLQVQNEMVNQGKDASDTEALMAERQELERVRKEQEAEIEAERRRMEVEQERARKEQEEKLRQEQENLRTQREAERVAEELRRAEAEREAQVAYEMQLEEIRKEREMQEEKMRREREEMEKREREERERQRAREEAAATERERQWRECREQSKKDDCIIL